MTASITAPITTPIALIYKGKKKVTTQIQRQRPEKRTEDKQCKRDRENANLSSYTKVVLGSGDDFVITDDENITLNLLRNALGGPTSHLQLQSFHHRPGLHAQQQ
jgi:hypothetical protein